MSQYDDFLRYLKRKNPAIRSRTLDFEGRNEVLYWHPSFEASVASAAWPVCPACPVSQVEEEQPVSEKGWARRLWACLGRSRAWSCIR